MRGNVIVEDQVSSPLTSEPYDTVGILMNHNGSYNSDHRSREQSILDTGHT
jgi:hypothetical protein